MLELHQLESDNPRLLASLKAARDSGPAANFAARVMERVRDEGVVTAALDMAKPNALNSKAFSDSVMARVGNNVGARRVAPTHNTIEEGATRRAHTGKHTNRLLRWVAYTGTAVAAGLAIAVFYTPGGATNTPNDAHGTGENPRAAAAPQNPAILANAQVRYARNYDGVERWVIDAGLMEGVRAGDVFEYREKEGTVPLGRLRVVGISAQFSICAVEERGLRTPAPRDVVTPLQATEIMREARAALDAGRPQTGAFLGLGAVFRQESKGLVAGEIIPEFWKPDEVRAKPSPAARLGLKRGDRLLAVQGRSVRNEAALERVLDGIEMTQPLTARVQRDGREIELPVR